MVSVKFPEFVKLPVNATIPVVPVSVPLFRKNPVVVSVLLAIFKVAPALIVTLTILVLVPTVTVFVPVVAIITSSPATGTTPPTQVEPVAHVPPATVLVLVAALTNETVKNKTETNTSFQVLILAIFAENKGLNDCEVSIKLCL